MVSSLDGIIAKDDQTVDWLDHAVGVYEAGVSTAADEEPIDCYVLGSRTYEHALVLGWPYGDTPTIVLTTRALPSTRMNVELYSGDIETLIKQKLARHRNVWLVGGALLSQRFLALGLVDEIRLMIAPILLGKGLRLFSDAVPEARWELRNVVAYKNGYVELSYAAT